MGDVKQLSTPLRLTSATPISALNTGATGESSLVIHGGYGSLLFLADGDPEAKPASLTTPAIAFVHSPSADPKVLPEISKLPLAIARDGNWHLSSRVHLQHSGASPMLAPGGAIRSELPLAIGCAEAHTQDFTSTFQLTQPGGKYSFQLEATGTIHFISRGKPSPNMTPANIDKQLYRQVFTFRAGAAEVPAYSGANAAGGNEGTDELCWTFGWTKMQGLGFVYEGNEMRFGKNVIMKGVAAFKGGNQCYLNDINAASSLPPDGGVAVLHFIPSPGVTEVRLVVTAAGLVFKSTTPV